MPATTAKGYPYPVGTDRVTDGDNAIAALATAVNDKIGVGASGMVTLPAPSGLSVPVSMAITFPAGRFTAAPAVMGTAQGGSPQAFAPVTTVNVTAAGCTLYCARVAGGMGTIVTGWLAIQV